MSTSFLVITVDGFGGLDIFVRSLHRHCLFMGDVNL